MDDRFITDEEVERALDYLRDNATAMGQARYEAIRAERMVKHIKALVMKMYSDLPISAQEREAYASDRYKEAVMTEAVAAGEFEKMRAMREAATMKIEAWRTMSSTYRATKI